MSLQYPSANRPNTPQQQNTQQPYPQQHYPPPMSPQTYPQSYPQEQMDIGQSAPPSYGYNTQYTQNPVNIEAEYDMLNEKLAKYAKQKKVDDYLRTDQFDPTEYEARAAVGLCKEKISLHLKNLEQTAYQGLDQATLNGIQDPVAKKAIANIYIGMRANREQLHSTLSECFKDLTKLEEVTVFKMEEFTSKQYRFNKERGLITNSNGEALPFIYQVNMIRKYAIMGVMLFATVLTFIIFAFKISEEGTKLAIDKIVGDGSVFGQAARYTNPNYNPGIPYGGIGGNLGGRNYGTMTTPPPQTPPQQGNNMPYPKPNPNVPNNGTLELPK